MHDQAERLRQLSRNVNTTENAAKNGRRTCRVVAVSSGKGGVGKTNLVLNLAIILAELKYRVLVIDTDIGTANIDVLINAFPQYTLMDVIKGYKDLKEIILEGPGNLKIIPGGSGLEELPDLDPERRRRILERFKLLEQENDVILIDTMAGISSTVLSFIGAADDVIVITSPEPTAITNAYSLIKVIARYNIQTRVNVVVNFIENINEGQETFARLERVTKRYLNLKLFYLGGIIYDPVVKEAVQSCSPFVISHPDSSAASSLHWVAQRFIFYLLEHGDAENAPRKKEEDFLTRHEQTLRIGELYEDKKTD